MGNWRSNNMDVRTRSDQFPSVEDFKFIGPFEEQDTNNGLFFNGTFIPDEILLQILSCIPPKQLLPLTLVCKKWCNIIKSEVLWMEVYNNYHKQKAKLLPWYVYYSYFCTDNFKNIIKNGNGKEKYKHWDIIKNMGDQFRIEDPPVGSDPLPETVSDFNGCTSCFATSFYECSKLQQIHLDKKRLVKYIMQKHKPHIYVSEWVAGRFDCGCKYQLTFKGYKSDYKLPAQAEHFYLNEDLNEPPLFEYSKEYRVEQFFGKAWEKVELIVEDYPENVKVLIFEHEGSDTQFWKGHYGSKMAGGVVRFLMDTIKYNEDNDTN